MIKKYILEEKNNYTLSVKMTILPWNQLQKHTHAHDWHDRYKCHIPLPTQQ